jgi:glycerophosphoryl diester phosphodiesterase
MLPERIGHGGASAVAPGNTLASFDAARAIGVDAIEFDVRAWRGELVLAHTVLHARRGGNVRLRDALAHLAKPSFSNIALHLDVKQLGYESEILAALHDAGLLPRSLLCSQLPAVLDRFRMLHPEAQVGISVGGRLARATNRWGNWREAALDGVAARRWNVLMVQHKLVDAELVASVARHRSRLYAWTVNQRALIGALQQLGVDGIATADPRLFG